MSANATPRFPLDQAARAIWNTAPGSGTIVGGDGAWDGTGTGARALWTLDEPGYPRHTVWDNRDGHSVIAVFGGTAPAGHSGSRFLVSLDSEGGVACQGLEFVASDKDYLLAGAPIRLKAAATVTVSAGRFPAIVADLRTGDDAPFYAFVKGGAGDLRADSVVMSSITTCTVDGGRLFASGYAGGAAAIRSATNLTVVAGAELVFDSASADIDLTGTLTGAGTIRISGGGRLRYHGRDVQQRPLATIPGWSGSFDSPPANSAPVITPIPGVASIPIGSTVTQPVTATDADGDALALTLPSNPYPSEVSVVGMGIQYAPTAARDLAIAYQVSDGFGGVASGTWATRSHVAYDAYISGFQTPTVQVGPASRAFASGTDGFRVGIAGFGATVGGDHGQHLRTVFSGAGNVAVEVESGDGVLNISGTSPLFTGSWYLPDDATFVCGGPWTGGLSSVVPAHIPAGSFAANPGPSRITASSGRLRFVVFGGLATGSSTISADIRSADVSFQGGDYTYSGPGIYCDGLGVLNASLTRPAGGAVPEFFELYLGWYVPGRATAPWLNLGASPQWYGDRWLSYTTFADTTPAGTHTLVSWTGGLVDGALQLRDAADYPSRYIVTTTATTKTWTRPGWGEFRFNRASGMTLVKY